MGIGVELYVKGGGRCPVQEFLDDLKRTAPGGYAAVLAVWPTRESTGWLSGLAAGRLADR
jgi:hypothetical protein